MKHTRTITPPPKKKLNVTSYISQHATLSLTWFRATRSASSAASFLCFSTFGSLLGSTDANIDACEEGRRKCVALSLPLSLPSDNQEGPPAFWRSAAFSAAAASAAAARAALRVQAKEGAKGTQRCQFDAPWSSAIRRQSGSKKEEQAPYSR